MAASKLNELVKVRLEEGASIPEQAHSQDVGYDIKSISCEYDEEHDMYIYHTGIYVETVEQEGFNKAIYLFPRSSNSKKECYLTNSVGIIDSDIYRGEIQVRFKNRTSLDTMAHQETCRQMLNELVSFRDRFVIEYDEMYKRVRQKLLNRAKLLEFAPYKVGEKCAQLVFSAERKVAFKVVEELNNDTDRGTSGFGDSGK